ncbi:MAG: class II fructose-bisphosphate aldolase, partial [Spirochaetota bacterium]
AVIRAAEDCRKPVILLTNRDFVQYAPPRHIGPVFADLAEHAPVPVCLHLDHNSDFAVIREALEAGYSSVMYDGSALPLEENIANSRQVVAWARAKGASVEGEVGSVAYTDKPESVTEFSTPEEAERYARESGVDALAVSVGTTHRSMVRCAEIRYELLDEIARRVPEPLVIHGTTSILEADLVKMPRHGVAKYNAGTVLRLAYAQTLRQVLQQDSQIFDKVQFSREPLEAVYRAAKNLIEKVS